MTVSPRGGGPPLRIRPVVDGRRASAPCPPWCGRLLVCVLNGRDVVRLVDQHELSLPLDGLRNVARVVEKEGARDHGLLLGEEVADALGLVNGGTREEVVDRRRELHDGLRG